MNKNTIFEKMIINFNSGIKTGSQTYFAKMLNIPVQTISAWVNGRSIPTGENIVQLAKIFDKSEEEIKKIFVQNTAEIINTENKNISLKDKERIKLLEEKIKILEERNGFLKEQVDFYKSRKQEAE